MISIKFVGVIKKIINKYNSLKRDFQLDFDKKLYGNGYAGKVIIYNIINH